MEKFRGSTKNNNRLNNKGQFAIEGVLLMTVLVSLFLLVMKYTKEKKLLQNLVSATVAGKLNTMAGFGTWKPDGCTAVGKSKQTLGKCHPNSIHRSLSSDPGL